jgi:CheY-like chemotaxis protein
VKESPARARILIASDSVEDAHLITKNLGDVFKNVSSSTDPERMVEDFETCQPDVLLLAFDTLEKSQRYYLGLYRLSSGAVQSSHRTVVLCGKDEVQAAFQLCTKGYFEDYVLFWPQSYDGRRLAMTVWSACRQAAPEDARPGNAELLLHAKHLAELERVVEGEDGGGDDGLRERLRPALAGTRPVAVAARALRPMVLVVDDDDFAQRLVQNTLDPLRWRVSFAADGAGALGHLRQGGVDLILMDVRMPGVDGITLTRRLKASSQTAAIPIVMMTGDARRETLVGSMDAGAAGFVVKPVTRATLEAKLDKILPR